jgi:hypothetical protein
MGTPPSPSPAYVTRYAISTLPTLASTSPEAPPPPRAKAKPEPCGHRGDRIEAGTSGHPWGFICTRCGAYVSGPSVDDRDRGRGSTSNPTIAGDVRDHTSARLRDTQP